MLRMALLFHIFIGSTLSGVAVIAALALGRDTLGEILVAAVIGFIASIPSTYFIAKQVYELND